MSDAAERDRADELAGRICVAASLSAQSEAQLLELIGEFDALDAVRWWDGVRSLAHWLGWACSMSAGTAREHVRVARALRRMPAVQRAFAEGRLSYSKVREVTRVVDVVDEARLLELALTATASQLNRMLAAFRAADGSRLPQQAKRQGRWLHRDDGMVDFRLRLPAEEAALLVAALDAARDRFGAVRPVAAEPAEQPEGSSPPPEHRDTTPAYGTADAVLDLARAFLASVPEDRSGEDRTLVVVHVAAEQLVPDGPDVDRPDVDLPGGTSEDVPAGTPRRTHSTQPPESAELQEVCQVAGIGPVEPATAARLACDADLVGAVVDRHGDVLALGRTRRLVSRSQRRALMIRDRMCRFPGCHRTRHLAAHHVVPWAAGGRTDLDNLVLLCSWHHTTVHEGRLRLTRAEDAGYGWSFCWPDGTPLRPWEGADALDSHLAAPIAERRERDGRTLAAAGRFDDPPARRIRPGWAGERFDRAACVDALFGMRYATAA
ncbi:hypothetical protein FHX74_003919 [Friedmanniella endophytica]|uniref:HNH nuclease domain-containing protein n=1 Tax=Microlunatus kandeliicorticis TaxID=1759536 RepID=A0A7W3IVY5_9ACTN|nr:HNH endonuclease signature motif containing protein [Microlunatus kandeliicorticis]MBA8796266.1 hypothetical protein [Microlunatus kandeliicorticis]